MWGEYGEWSACSATCDDGTRARKRPEAIPAENGGAACSGSATEKETCNNEICQGSTILKAMQKIILNTGNTYNYKNNDIIFTNIHAIIAIKSTDYRCVWGKYGEWSACSATCDGGSRTRTRPEGRPASNGGAACSGSATETEACNTEICPGSKTLKGMQRINSKYG